MRNDLRTHHAAALAPALAPALASRRPRRLALADVQAFAAPARQTCHASRRAAQRNLAGAIDYIMAWGRPIQRTGVCFYFLGRRDIPPQHRHLPQIARLAGSVALLSPDGEVITLYRNADALREIERKMKYRFTPGYPVFGHDAADDTKDEVGGARSGSAD
ncbi:MAG TPA: hypothetical protein VFX31_12565 [Ktedonobacterales bacterium]|nr:hypothetical protein [Ktedonobacterales bacterium]HEX5572216.1 hypothetical protein [Ktedonobacterales bacterium]